MQVAVDEGVFGAGDRRVLWGCDLPDMVPEQALNLIRPWGLDELNGISVVDNKIVCMMDFGTSLSVFNLDTLDHTGMQHNKVVTRTHFRGCYEDAGFIACCITADQQRVAAVNEAKSQVTLLELDTLLEERSDSSDADESDSDEDAEVEDDGWGESDDDEHELSLPSRAGSVRKLRSDMMEAVAPFPARPLKKHGGVYRCQGGPEVLSSSQQGLESYAAQALQAPLMSGWGGRVQVVAVRGGRLAAGFADGSIRLQRLSQLASASDQVRGTTMHTFVSCACCCELPFGGSHRQRSPPSESSGVQAPASTASFSPFRFCSSDDDDSQLDCASVYSDDEEAGSEEYEASGDEGGLISWD